MQLGVVCRLGGRGELMADWALAISGEAIFKIDPLK